MKRFFWIPLLPAVLAAFSGVPDLPPGARHLEPSAQRPGNADAGYTYLVTGDYVSAGIPMKVFRKMSDRFSSSDLGRTGDNEGIPYMFNAITASNGAKVVAPTCLTCHAEYLNGRLVLGLGNNTADYTSTGPSAGMSDFAVRLLCGDASPETENYQTLRRAKKAIDPMIRTEVQGVNPADKIFAVLAAHRRPSDFVWLEKAQFEVPREVIPTDVPAWWNVKKKNALYYNGLGRGDFARLSTASDMLTMRDSAEARRVDDHFADVLAWIRTLEPPVYPFPVDSALVTRGAAIFDDKCAKCHGHYGQGREDYPNLLAAYRTVGTDSMLATMYKRYPEYHNWYNRSWYALTPPFARMEPTEGYVAPPLDGIWATAPYLHNGSVPTVYDLLNSPQRPGYWRRSFNNSDYDPVKMGWQYERLAGKRDRKTYDTTLPGYRNTGHRFGDKLTEDERKAVVEYLKTL